MRPTQLMNCHNNECFPDKREFNFTAGWQRDMCMKQRMVRRSAGPLWEGMPQASNDWLTRSDTNMKRELEYFWEEKCLPSANQQNAKENRERRTGKINPFGFIIQCSGGRVSFVFFPPTKGYREKICLGKIAGKISLLPQSLFVRGNHSPVQGGKKWIDQRKAPEFLMVFWLYLRLCMG